MAFRARSKFRGKRFAKRGSKRSSYELAQFSICNRELLLGLSDCRSLDQQFFPIVVAREWVSPNVQVAATGLTQLQAFESHSGKSVTVKGIQFEYALTHRPETFSPEDPTIERFTTVYARCGLVKMRIAQAPLLQEFTETIPMDPPQNILHYAGTMRRNTADGVLNAGISEEERTHLRTMWRSLQVIDCVAHLETEVIAPGVTPIVDTLPLIANYDTMKWRHARVRTSVRLGMDEALFFVVESFNSGLTFSPTLQFNMLGTCAIKTNWRGPVVYDTQSVSFAAP